MDPNITVTHRITKKNIDNNITTFVTKGDANDDDDMEDVAKSFIIGKTFVHIPYLGYAVNFAKTKQGLILIIIIPAVIIVYEEILKIKDEINRILREKEKRKKRQFCKIYGFIEITIKFIQ